MTLHFGTLQDCRPLDADPVLDDDAWPDGDVGTYPAVLPDLGGGVHDDVAHDAGSGGQHVGLLPSQAGEVETHPSEEVCWLTNVHPET